MKKPSWKKAIELYQKIGMSAVIEYADKFKLPYSMCVPCDTETPTYQSACLVCSSQKEL